MRIRLAVALLLVSLVVSSGFVQAVTSEYVDNDLVIDFQPVGSNDVVVNRMDDATESNRDTWDPEPQGIWMGGWAQESRLALEEVPATDFCLGLATVVRFSPALIGSGASQVLVRLPVYTGEWTHGYLNIYEVDTSSNWTFVDVDYSDYNMGSALNNFRLNFTAGTHRLVSFTHTLGSDDLSPTDGNDHFTRSNRTYVMVNAAIRPNTYYLVVGYFQYDADAYVEFYFQPDSLTEGTWNRSTVAFYNEYAPDSYNLPVHNYPVALGWSFDFRRGYGGHGAVWDAYFNPGDRLTFAMRVNTSRTRGTDYLSYMHPYWSTIPNISIDYEVEGIIPDNDPFVDGIFDVLDEDWEFTDYVINSSDDDTSTIFGADLADWEGWLTVYMVFNNATRLRFFLRDCPSTSNYWQADWQHFNVGSHGLGQGYAWDNNASWDITQYFVYTKEEGVTDTFQLVFFQLDYSIKPTPFQYQISAVGGSGQQNEPGVTAPAWADSWFWVGTYLVLSGVMTVAFGGGGFAMAYTTTQFLYAGITQIRELVDQYIHDALDDIWDRLQDIGHWAWKVGQRIAGVLEDVLDKIIWLATTIMGMGILTFSVAIFFLFPYITMRLGMAIRAAVKGDVEEAVEQVHAAANTAVKALETAGKLRPRRVLKRLRR